MTAIEKIREQVIRKNSGWHEGDDGLGMRLVYLNGKLVHWVIRANERKGIVVVTDRPAKLDKYGKRIITRTLRGKVTIEWPVV